MTPRGSTAVLLAAVLFLSVLTLALVMRVRDANAAYAALAKRTELPFPGYVMPTVKVPLLSGDSITIGATAERTTRQVVFVFTTTCPYCRATLPVWQSIADSVSHLPDMQVEVVALSLDSTHTTAGYAEAHAVGYPVGFFPDWKAARLFRAAMVPQTMVLSHVGEVLYAHVGALRSGPGLDSLYMALRLRPESAKATRTPESP